MPDDRQMTAQRRYDVDVRTTTGAYHVVRGKYGRRKGDKPLWWVFAYHGAKAIVQVATALALLGIAAWAKRCGLDLPGTGP